MSILFLILPVKIRAILLTLHWGLWKSWLTVVSIASMSALLFVCRSSSPHHSCEEIVIYRLVCLKQSAGRFDPLHIFLLALSATQLRSAILPTPTFFSAPCCPSDAWCSWCISPTLLYSLCCCAKQSWYCSEARSVNAALPGGLWPRPQSVVAISPPSQPTVLTHTCSYPTLPSSVTVRADSGGRQADEWRLGLSPERLHDNGPVGWDRETKAANCAAHTHRRTRRLSLIVSYTISCQPTTCKDVPYNASNLVTHNWILRLWVCAARQQNSSATTIRARFWHEVWSHSQTSQNSALIQTSCITKGQINIKRRHNNGTNPIITAQSA